MLAVAFCLLGVFAILVIGELLGQKKIIQGDRQRKFIHIAVGTFIAFWPWFISWKAIVWIGFAMLAVVVLNHRYKLIDFHTKIKRESKSYGDIFFALAVIASALLADSDVFFAMAMLIMALGDGLANLVGQQYGGEWRYKVFNHTKTVIGTMVMWFVALCILGVGLLFAHEQLDYGSYVLLILFLPPILALVENFAILGFDNLLIPTTVLLALRLI
jgi:phytol kinase